MSRLFSMDTNFESIYGEIAFIFFAELNPCYAIKVVYTCIATRVEQTSVVSLYYSVILYHKFNLYKYEGRVNIMTYIFKGVVVHDVETKGYIFIGARRHARSVRSRGQVREAVLNAHGCLLVRLIGRVFMFNSIRMT